MKDVKQALIDIDGTVVETDQLYMDDPEIRADFFRGILYELLMEKFGISKEEALALIHKNEIPFNGCMFKTAEKIGINIIEYWERVIEWQKRNVTPYPDAVEMIRELDNAQIELYIVSNNSTAGILAKLHRAGLAEQTGSPYFKMIFGMELFGLGYSKGRPEVFSRIIEIGKFDPENIMTIGDDESQDWKIPESVGIRKSTIIKRNQEEPVLKINDGVHFVNSLSIVPEILGGL